MVKVLYSTLTPALKQKADREGRHFGKYVYGTKKEATQAREQQSKARPSNKKGTPKGGRPNTSAAFWVNIPGPRETVVHTAGQRAQPRHLIDRKSVLAICGGSTTTTAFGTLSPTLPNDYEVTGIKIAFKCGILHRDVKVQVLVLLAKTVRDASALDWDTIAAIPACKSFADVQSIRAEYKVPINRPINTGTDTDEACLIIMTRAVDSDPPEDAFVEIDVHVSCSQLKAGVSSLDF